MVIDIKDFTTPISKYPIPITEYTYLEDTRDNTLQKLLFEYSKLEDKYSEQAVNLEESIIKLGWIPGIPYNTETQLRAGMLQEKSSYDIIDKTKETVSGLEEDISELLKPVYIVLVEGTSIFSKAIKAYTNGPFSHACICIDNTFKKMYSFNLHHAEGKHGSGLSVESVDRYNEDSKLGVFAIFVKEKDYHTIETLLEMYEKKAKDTAYSIFNVFTLLANKSIKMDFNMICSEFVDNILKMTNIELVDKDSPLVTPNDFYKASKKNKKIFKLYEGKVKNFVPKTIVSRVNKVKKQYIKEYALLEADFPIEFSDDGDLIIKNIKKLNYDEELSKAKTLLKIYYKEDNIEGMKYELAKVWFIINLIISDINSNKKDNAKLTKTKATAINIHTTYMKLLLNKEKDFNFTEYYNSTPFNDATIRVKHSTIKYSIDTIKQLILI